MYEMVDNSDGPHKCSCTVPDCYPISALLQLPGCVCQVSGIPRQLLVYLYPSNNDLVLASPHNLPLFWSSVTRSRLPRVLPHPILAITRRIIWSIAGAFLLVTIVCNDFSDMPLANGIDAILRAPTLLNTRLHLVEAKPRYALEFPWPACFHSSISALGVDGFQPGVTWHGAKGRNYGSSNWTCLVLLLGCLPTPTQWIPSV